MVASILMLAGQHDEADAFLVRGGVAPFTVAATDIIEWTITENTGSGQTNVPIEIGLPLAANILTSTRAIQLLDSDGVTVIPCQEDNRVSDIAPGVRGVKVSAILPTITASQKRQLKLQYLTSSTPATGTDITTAEITATGYDCTATVAYSDGVTYTASAAAALAAGAWASKTALANQGKWRTGGGLVTEYVVYAPLKNGGTPCPGNLYAKFCISAWKASRGAVSGGNPIIAIKTQPWTGNAFVQQTATVDCWYDLTFTSGSTTKSWVGSAPAQTLTINGGAGLAISSITWAGGVATVTTTANHNMDGVLQNSSVTIQGASPAGYNGGFQPTVTGGNTFTYPISNPGSSPATGTISYLASHLVNQSKYTATVPSGSPFTANSVGMVIADGTGYGVIVKYNNANSVDFILMKAFAGLTRVSGAWRIYGINHPNATDMPQQELWYSGLATPNIDSTLGVAWNTGSLTGGPFTYIRSTDMILPYSSAASGITNDLTNLNAQGTNISGYQSNAGYNGGSYAGDITMYMPEVGGRPDIAPIVGWHVDAMIRADANSKAVIFGDANKLSLAPWNFIDQNTGLVPAMNNGTDWSMDSRFGTLIAPVSPALTINNWTIQTAHNPQAFYVPWLYTMDYYWADKLQKHAFWIWMQNSPGAGNTQLTRQSLFNDEARGDGWRCRTVACAILATPDRNVSTLLGWSKSHGQTWFANNLASAKVTYIDNTGPGLGYDTNGPHFLATGGNGEIFSLWMHGYCSLAFSMIKGMGMQDTNFDLLHKWLVVTLTGAVLSTDVVPQFIIPAYWVDAYFPHLTALKSWANVYQAFSGNYTYGTRRAVAAGATLTGALTGASVPITMAAGVVTTGQAFYVNGYIQDQNAVSVAAAPTITGAGTGYAVNDTILMAFTSGFTLVTRARLKVTSIGGGGAITGVSIDIPGVYTNPGTGGGDGDYSATQFSTSGVGTGATFTLPIHYGFGTITAVSGNNVTMTCTGLHPFHDQGSSGFQTNYPFAQATLTSSKYLISPPAPGDTLGTTAIIPGDQNPAMPTPYVGYYEYWDIAQSAAIMYNKHGFPNASAALTSLNSLYSGGNQSKWKVA